MKKIFILFALILSSVASAASFDCSKASTNTELAICENQQLSILDEIMALSYRQLMKEVNDKEQLKTDQLAFLAKNKRCNGNVDCLKQNYIFRTVEVSTGTVDLRSFLEKKKWISLGGMCGSETGGFSYQKGAETITLILGCNAQNMGSLIDIEIESSQKSASNPAKQEPAPPVRAQAQPKQTNRSVEFSGIVSKFHEMTEIQQTDYAASFVGTLVEGEGKLTEAQECTFLNQSKRWRKQGCYELTLDNGVPRAVLYLSKQEKNKIVSFNKGTTITFKNCQVITIKNWGFWSTLYCDL
jgi:Uncharacterized protein conserved in bacteria, putative lipoprotein